MRGNGCGPTVVIYRHCFYRLEKSTKNTSEAVLYKVTWIVITRCHDVISERFRILLRYDGLSKLKYGIQHV
jgi:hypothetical protein